MKYEWRKNEKNIYLPKAAPELVVVPKAKYFCINGKGNPNNQDFADRIAALYALSYAVRMMPKNGFTPEGYFEYTVYPLEGLWDLTELGRQKSYLDKDELVYTIMIKQPDFVSDQIFARALATAKNKTKNPLLDKITFTAMEDGLSVQMMHIGPYDTEAESFDKMKNFIAQNNLQIKTLVHKEIYISDTRKVAPEKLNTVLRYTVTKS